jgi:NAD(P)-dependent dehydrogenase (short-subunit alcohol dehydrogenase family)
MSAVAGRKSLVTGGRTLESMNAHGRLVSPEGVASLILTLCLPASRDVTSAELTIDGGTTA